MLSSEQIEFYREQGYLIVSDVFTSDELDRMEAEFDTVIESRAQAGHDLGSTWGGDWKEDLPAMKLDHTHDVQKYSAEWGRVLYHERFTECAAAPYQAVSEADRNRRRVSIASGLSLLST